MSPPSWPEEHEESRSRLFTTLWPVAEDYIIEEGVLYPLLGGQKFVLMGTQQVAARELLDPTYMPLAHSELPSEFAKVSGGGEDKVLAFVRRYGHLGYSEALTEFEAGALRLAKDSQYEMPFALDKGYDPQLPGDPLAWIFAHADTVKLAGDLAAALQRPSGARALLERRITESLHPGGAAVLGPSISYARATRGWRRPHQVYAPAPGHPHAPEGGWEGAALRIIASILNANLGGVRRFMSVEDEEASRPGLVSLFQPRNLLDGIYWLLADEVAGEQLRTCQACGHFFAATDERMKYCPPPKGIEGPSRCMHREKMRRFREKRRAREARGKTRRRRGA
jgi:hypothetical protein